jgi:hypothetical protein
MSRRSQCRRQFFAHDDAVIRHPAAAFRSISVNIDRVSFVGFPFCLYETLSELEAETDCCARGARSTAY